MKNPDRVSGVFWMAVGALFLAGALQQGLFRRGVPGPGFLPFLTAAAFIILSLLVLTGSRKPGEKKKESFPAWDRWKKILLAFLGLLGYGALLGYAGYVLTTFLFLVFAMKILEPKSWRTALLVSAAAAASTYVLFAVLLEVQLPKGILQF